MNQLSLVSAAVMGAVPGARLAGLSPGSIEVGGGHTLAASFLIPLERWRERQQLLEKNTMGIAPGDIRKKLLS